MTQERLPVADIIRLAGGPSAVACAIGRHHATVLGWERVPPQHALKVAALAGLHPHNVRPDLYDPPPLTSDQSARGESLRTVAR